MGTYYQYTNYTKKEIICCSGIASIKWGAFAGWSLQGAILNTFLGFDWRGSNKYPCWSGRWKGDKIALEADCDDNESDDWETVKDVGEEFIIVLRDKGILNEWLNLAGVRDKVMMGEIEKLGRLSHSP